MNGKKKIKMALEIHKIVKMDDLTWPILTSQD